MTDSHGRAILATFHLVSVKPFGNASNWLAPHVVLHLPAALLVEIADDGSAAVVLLAAIGIE